MMQNPEAKFKLTQSEKTTVRDELRAILIDLARSKTTATYTEVCQRLQTVMLHPHSYIFAHLLREVCLKEEAQGHGILCALVVSKMTGMPGAGYFASRARRGTPHDDLTVGWQNDVEEVFAYWSDH